ncbi:MAG TPA: nitroreductase family deazaflavin-dependent oxidoreductase [Candidatus Limnocylindrales bacterium]|nr:nitroreductase family deazaflavin-dependent oxidoreductase [Candidatus Limnocylindrales bacterium]
MTISQPDPSLQPEPTSQPDASLQPEPTSQPDPSVQPEPAGRSRPPARAPRIVPLMGPLVQRLIGTGLPLGPNVLLTVRGRSTGLERTVPLALLESGERWFVSSPYGEVDWVRNLRAAGRAVVTRHRRRTEVEAVELTPEAGGAVLHAATAPYRRSALGRRLIRLFYGLSPEADLEAYVAQARRHPIFELRVH